MLSSTDIKVIGIFLSNYETDLTYISNFQKHKTGELLSTDYIKKQSGMFKGFVNEFRVARNVHATKTDQLLSATMQWVASKESDDVDGFAQHLKNEKISHKTATSLASKILYLNNPWIIFPYDRLAKNALKTRKVEYVHYLPLVNKFMAEKKDHINRSLSEISHLVETIEKPFQLENIDVIRKNRYVDKYLWNEGK